MAFSLPALPYKLDALTPYISSETLEYHYGKHHATYVNNLNKLIVGTEFEHSTLEHIIGHSTAGIFNNAAQVWNHTFYWNCLTANATDAPTGEILNLINQYFGSFAIFKEQFTHTAVTTFGSGWVWLVQEISGDLKIKSTSNAGTPMTDGSKALLTCDVWEHAYYIDYRNARADYLNNFWAIVNWSFVNKNLI